MDRFDFCIAGAGVVGLAIAHRLLEAFPKASIVLTEQESGFGQQTSSRLSEVIHAGIYYPPGSLKARLCVEGKEALYTFCDKYRVPYRRIGKLILSNSDCNQAITKLAHNAKSSGVDDLEYWAEDRIKVAEPAVRAAHALYSPSTGILDSHQYMQTLLTLNEQRGMFYAPRTKITAVQPSGQGFCVKASINSRIKTEAYRFNAKWFINSAGLWSQQLAGKIENLPASSVPKQFLCKGEYFDYRGTNPFTHLIYPLPDSKLSGLGIHSTQDLSGQLRFGPDAEYVEEVDYRVTPDKYRAFARAIRNYFPSLEANKLVPAYAGIRPKINGPDEKPGDFIIAGPQDSGIPGLIQLFGIESPGLTASLSIGSYVSRLIGEVSL